MTLMMKTLAGGTAFLLSAAVSISFAAAEDAFKPGKPNAKIPCPHPSSVALVLNTPNPVSSEFPGQPPPVLAGLGDTTLNRPFRHTFAWPEPEGFCCEITSAKLVVDLIANGPGNGNDSIGIYSGVNVSGMGGYIYHSGSPGPAQVPDVATGTSKTIICQMNAAALNNMNTDHSLSLGIQDDTLVKSVTLTIDACCVTAFK